MSLIKKIDDNIIMALKGGEKEKLTVLRGLKSELKYKLIAKGEDLNNADILAVLSSAAKKRRESIEQFNNAERKDLADKEESELKIIEQYLPAQLDEAELRQIVADAIEETGVDTPQKIGLIMKVVMPKIKGRADGKMVNKMVLELLNKAE